MKTDWEHLEVARMRKGTHATNDGDTFGAFYFRRGRVELIVIASSGDTDMSWEHVSVRAKDYCGERVPSWAEMCWIKDQFWDAEECVVQYHPPRSEYVNNHPHVLHLWKPTAAEMPRPPAIAVGIKEAAT